ncbi:Protein of unknown function [Gryllus bimaculatus]|jgi:hypothetical protein
MTLF